MFDLKLTRGLGVFAVLAVVVVPLYLFIYVSPSLQDHIINDGQEEANRVANHLAAMFVKADRVSAETLPANLDQRISAVSREFKLAKLKIFSPSGEIVYSTEPAEVGTVNRNSYFHEIVASGRKYSKLVQKEEATLEGQTFKADLVEAYVPVMRGPQFIGAFEVYYDVTAQLADLRQLLHGFYRIILPIVFFAVTVRERSWAWPSFSPCCACAATFLSGWPPSNSCGRKRRVIAISSSAPATPS